MFTLPNVSKPDLRVFGIPASWFRKVTAYLTNICAGTGIRITQPGEPSASAPVKIEIDPDWVRAMMPRETAPDSETGGDASAEDTTEASTPAAPTLAADDDSADFTSGGDTLSDGDAIDTTNHPDAANDTLRWMNNAAANALGGYDAGEDEPTGDWDTQTALTTADPFDGSASPAQVSFRHHVPMRCLIFTRDKQKKEAGANCKLLFARPAEIEPGGRIRYVGAEIVVARVLDYRKGSSTVSATVTDSSSPSVEGIVDADVTAYSTYSDAAVHVGAASDAAFSDGDGQTISGVVWRAGLETEYKEATVTRFVPLWVGSNHTTLYFKVFVRIHKYLADGRLYEVRNEVDHGIILRGYN